MLETALYSMRDAQRGYAQADPYVKRLWNRTRIERIAIKGRPLAGVELQQPYAAFSCWRVQIRRCLVGGTGHYLNRTAEFKNILELMRIHRDALALQRHCRASTLAGVSRAQVEDLVGAAGQPGHDLGDPGGGSVGPFAWVRPI